MGASNATKVFTHWRHLSHREARALTYMALVALDAGKPPVYFGGWEAVASALGLDCEGKRNNAKEQFRRTMAALVASGAVVSSGQAKLGVRAEYALSLDLESTFQPAGIGRNVRWTSHPRIIRATEKVPHLGHRQGAPVATEKVPQVGHPKGGERDPVRVPPRSTEEPQGGVLDEQQGGITLTQASSLTNAHEGKADDWTENLPLEDERAKQMAALERLIAKEERKAS